MESAKESHMEYAKEDYVLSWILPVDSIHKNQLKSFNALTMMDHMKTINYDCNTRNNKMTQIMCTMGPSCQMPQQLEQMLEYGMTIARINMVHGDIDQHRQEINALRMSNNNWSSRQGLLMTMGIAVEVHGPEIRTGKLEIAKSGIDLKQGDTIQVTCDPAYYNSCNAECIYVGYDHLREVVKPGNRIVIDAGIVVLRVLDLVSRHINCQILTGGKLGNDRKVNLPEVPLNMDEMSTFTQKDIAFAVKYEVDYIIVKRVRHANQIEQYRKQLGEEGKYIQIIAKIESIQGLDNIEEIVAVADALMFSKHDMVGEMPVENVCLAQKCVIGHAIMAGKPCICEVHTAHAGSTVKISSRAVADAHGTIVDGADCVMLAGETALGQNPANGVRLLDRVCKQSELSVWHRQMYSERNLKAEPPNNPAESIAIGAVETAIKCNAQAIVVLTTTGRSAILISKYAPRCPIIAVTRHGRVARQLLLYRGTKPLQYIYGMLEDWMRDVNLRLQYGVSFGKVSGFIKAGDAVLMVHGCRQGAGFTNTLRIVYASEFDTIPVVSK